QAEDGIRDLTVTGVQTCARPIYQLDHLTSETDPLLRSRFGVGPDTAAALLLAAGDNPARLRSEASFSMLCGSSPVQASSGQTKQIGRASCRERRQNSQGAAASKK